MRKDLPTGAFSRLLDDSAPSEIQAFIRYASRAPIHASTEASRASSGRSEHLKKLLDGIHFSKRFILSYQLVLVGLLAAFTVIHWGSRLRAWRRRYRKSIGGKSYDRGYLRLPTDESKGESKGEERVAIKSIGSGNSSSSSTLEASISYTNVNYEGTDESSPLLPKGEGSLKFSRSWLILSKLKAWLVYQPRPLRFINKTLPSNGTSLLVLMFIALQVFYTLFKVPLSLSMLFVFADRTSLLFIANLPLLYLFAAKNQPIKLLTGYSYEELNIFHRRLGEVLCLLALLHSAGMIGVWYTVLRPVGLTLIKFILMKIILLGLGALVAYELIYFTSLGTFRQKWYELFLVSHVFLQAAALILVWFHHHGSRPYVGIALGIFLVDRLVYRILLKTSTIQASLEIKEDNETVTLSADIRPDEHRQSLRYVTGATCIKGGWKATEHVFLTVPSLAPKHIIQAHPFTIASKAPHSQAEKASLELLVRAQSGFSADLVRHARSHETVAVRLDGPYGSQSAIRLLNDSVHTVVVAGGSGLAVAWPMLSSLLEVSDRDLEDPYRARADKKCLFIWVVREQSHISWLGDQKMEYLKARGVTVVVPPPTSIQGHPDIKQIIESWFDGFGEHDFVQKIGVVASGPDGLNRAVRNTCASWIKQGMNVSIEIEKFGW